MQGVTDLFADILYSGEEDNGLGDDETEEEVDEGWEREGKLEGRLRGLGEGQWGDEMEGGGGGEARGAGRERLPRSESSSPHKLHPARWGHLIVQLRINLHTLHNLQLFRMLTNLQDISLPRFEDIFNIFGEA